MFLLQVGLSAASELELQRHLEKRISLNVIMKK